jgi:ribokinase
LDPRAATLSKPVPERETPRVLCHGLVASDFLLRTSFPVPLDLKVRVERVVRQGGGPAANAAVGLARLGASVTWAGAVGSDALGREQLDELAAERVDVHGANVVAGAASFVSFILVDRATGARTIFSAPAGRPLAPAEGARIPAPRPHLVLVDGWGGRAQRRVAELARAAGIPVLLDAGSLRDEVLELVPLAEVVIASMPFADALSGDGRHDAALAALRAMGPRLVAVTRGKRGCVAAAEGSSEPFEVAALPVEAVDTTGAGDAFHAGAAWGLLRGRTWESALRFAAAVAACKCRRVGARDGLPRERDVERFLDTLGVPG